MKKVISNITVTILFLLAAEALWAQKSQSVYVPTVTVTDAIVGEVEVRIPISGTLVAKELVEINPRISGFAIETILVEIGDKVRAGDVLLKLDRQLLQAELLQAQADVIRAEASLRQAQSQIDVAQASLVQADAALKRNQKLKASGNVATSTIEDSKANSDSARASYQSVVDGLVVATSQLTLSKIKLDLAKLNLSYADIETPVDGVIVARSATLGAIASAGNLPLFSIVENGEIELEAEVVETALVDVQPGNMAEITLSGIGEKTGKVRLISPSVDPESRLGLIRISLARDPAIRTGIFAKGWVITAVRESVLIPFSSILSTQDGSFAMVVKDNTVEKRAIIAGVLYGNSREVLEGIKEGEQVLIRPGNFYRGGDKVRIAHELPAKSTEPSK